MRLPKDPLFRLLFVNGVAGVAIAILVLVGIFWANIGNLRTLVAAAEDPVLPVLMLGFGLVITLGSVVIGSAIMLLGDNSGGGGTRRIAPRFKYDNELRAVPVAAASRRRNPR